MKTYTLHLPADARSDDPRNLETATLVKDGFSWGAFFFTALWFFARRLWLAGLLVLIAVVGLGAALAALGAGAGTIVWAELLLAWLIGLEAESLRRWTYRRRCRPAVDVVLASNLEEAEAKSFARWLARNPAAPSAPASFRPVAAHRAPEPVIGLFPEAERRP
jgi:hypothetical protein